MVFNYFPVFEFQMSPNQCIIQVVTVPWLTTMSPTSQISKDVLYRY